MADIERIENIFHEAIALVASQRSAYLAEVCGNDLVARREVESLVSAFEKSDGRFDDSAVTLALRVMGSTPAETMTGRQIGAYKVLGFLGRGGMGEVYLAEDRHLNRKVALKFLSSEFVADSWAKRQLIKEAQAVAKLDHPNICAVLGFEEVGEHSFIVMPFIEGQTLSALIHANAIRPAQIVPLAQQIVSALAEAHAHGIIHRDMKPKNIMVTESGQVKVLDFGLAKTIQNKQSFEDATESISQLSSAGLLVGTVAYMSPEQLRGERLDFRTDIFSVGTVLYELTSGKNPHAQKTGTEVISNAEVISAIIRVEEPALRQMAVDCPKGLDRVVHKCLRKERDERYGSANELLIDLDNLLKGVPAPIHSYISIRSVALATVLLALIFITLRFIIKPARVSHTLAVLPIVCEGIDSKTQCVGQSLTDDLVNAFARRTGLRVERSTVAPSLYGPRAASPQKLARNLNADTVFFGTIRQKGNSLVLQTRLENVNDGSRIAEQEYPFDSDKLSLLEQQLSLETAFDLQLPLNSDDRNLIPILAAQQNRTPQALELYLRGKSYWNKRDRANIQKAIELFQQAIDQDPLYARAYAGLADCYVLMNTVAYGAMPTQEAMNKADWAAKEALKLDETLPDAHTSLGVVWLRYRWNWENAEKEFKRAIELNSEFQPAHYWYSSLLAITGRREESLKESELARDLLPLSGPAIMNHCRTLYFARKIDAADACLESLASEQPQYIGGKYMHGVVYLQKGKYLEATRIYEEIYAQDKAWGGAMLGYCYGITGRKAEALKILAEMQALIPMRGYVPALEFAIIYFGLNDRDNTFAMLRTAADDRFAPLASIFVDPMFDSLRSDPRFVALAKEFKLPPRPPAA